MRGSWLPRASGFWLVRTFGLGLMLLVVACGPDASPTTPTGPPAPGPAGGPAGQLSIVIDSLGSEEAITALSDVAFDASNSTGAVPLTYRLDFGDGASAATATARHIYNTPGSYTAAVTVTDAAGRATTASKPVVVRSVSGAWLHAGYSAGSRQVLVRRLSVTSQAGTTVRGFVGRPNQPDRPVTGELVPPRTLRLAFDDPAFGSLEGVLPRTFGQTDSLELRALGGPADSERLVFRPTEGEPTGPPPDAVLNHRYFSFGAPFAIRGFSPMRFDGSGSRGDGLSYFIEFGDGGVSTEPVAVHPIEEHGRYTARLTVVDRFGRADVEAIPILVLSFFVNPSLPYHSTYDDIWIAPTATFSCLLWIDSQAGAALTAFFSSECGSFSGNAVGRLSGDDEIHLVHGSGAVLDGTVQLGGASNRLWRMNLVQTGGAEGGRSLIFQFDAAS